MPPNITVIIPAINEELSICKVLDDIPKDLVTEIIVVDNGSSDQTMEKAKSCGAMVLKESQKGYGSACLCGIDYLRKIKELPIKHGVICKILFK